MVKYYNKNMIIDDSMNEDMIVEKIEVMECELLIAKDKMKKLSLAIESFDDENSYDRYEVNGGILLINKIFSDIMIADINGEKYYCCCEVSYDTVDDISVYPGGLYSPLEMGDTIMSPIENKRILSSEVMYIEVGVCGIEGYIKKAIDRLAELCPVVLE